MTREEEENETGGVAGYAMVDNEGMVHLGHAPFFTVSFGDNMGRTCTRENPLGQCMQPGEKQALPERISTKASAA